MRLNYYSRKRIEVGKKYVILLGTQISYHMGYIKSMKHTITYTTASVALVAAFAGILFLSLPGYSSAQGDGVPVTTTKKSKEVRTKNVDASCMQTAVDTREASLSTSWSTLSSSMTSALSSRKSALNTAWGLTDVAARNKALATAWKDWKSASKAANTTMRTDRKATWDAFKTTAKDSCKVTTPKDEALPKDEAGAIAL